MDDYKQIIKDQMNLQAALQQAKANPYESRSQNIASLQAEIERRRAEVEMQRLKDQYMQQVQNSLYPPIKTTTLGTKNYIDPYWDSVENDWAKDVTEEENKIKKQRAKEEASILERMLKSVI